jgi:hypothetical protein
MLLVKCILVGMIMVKCILGRFIHKLCKLCDDTSSAFFGAVALDKEPRRSLLRVFGFHKTHQLMSKCERNNLKYYYNAFGISRLETRLQIATALIRNCTKYEGTAQIYLFQSPSIMLSRRGLRHEKRKDC